MPDDEKQVDWHILNDADPNENADEAIGFFERIASEYRDCPNLLFEICNEPNGSTDWGDVLAYCDWCPIGGDVKSTLEFTDTVTIFACANMAAFIFDVLGQADAKAYACGQAAEYRGAIRAHLIDRETCVADTGCQTSQAMALYYGVFDEAEEEKATAYLLRIIHENGDFLDTGILGARVIFHVLSSAGESGLAWKMITRKEFPSYGALAGFGETTIPEFFDLPGEGNYSHNHHMYCDIKNWFISAVAGLRYNPDGTDLTRVLIQPALIEGLAFAEARYGSPAGEIFVRWERTDEGAAVRVRTAEGIAAEVVLPDGTRIAHTGDNVYSFRPAG